jgi:hypothetical protein
MQIFRLLLSIILASFCTFSQRAVLADTIRNSIPAFVETGVYWRFAHRAGRGTNCVSNLHSHSIYCSIKLFPNILFSRSSDHHYRLNSLNFVKLGVPDHHRTKLLNSFSNSKLNARIKVSLDCALSSADGNSDSEEEQPDDTRSVSDDKSERNWVRFKSTGDKFPPDIR